MHVLALYELDRFWVIILSVLLLMMGVMLVSVSLS